MDKHDLLISATRVERIAALPLRIEQPTAPVLIETEIFSFSRIILLPGLTAFVVTSELRNQTKIKTIGFREIDRHPCLSVANADFPPRPFVLDGCGGG